MADPIRDAGLAHEAARLTQPPEYDVLLARAGRARRRRRVGTVAASVAVAVALVGTGALLTDTTRQTSPDPVEPPTPGPSRTVEPSPRPVDDARREADRLRALSAEEIVAEGRAAYFVVNEDGAILTYWYVCGGQSEVCVGAWRLVSESGTVTTILQERGGWPPIMEPAQHGFLVKTVNFDRTFLLSSDGSRRSVKVGDPPLPIEAGQVTVRDGDRFNVVDPGTGNAWALLQPDDVERIDSPVIDDTGRVWAIGSQFAAASGANEVIWTDDPETGWQRFRFDTERNLPGRVVVQGEHVVATSAGDGATIAPVEKFAVSADRGSSWTVLESGDLPFQQTYGMAATDGGCLFVADYDGRVWRSVGTDWTRFERVRDVPEIESLAPSEDTVLGITRSREPVFVRIEDNGSFTTFPAR